MPKVIIEGEVYFHHEMRTGGMKPEDDEKEVPIEVVGPPDEDLDDWAILLVHPKVSIKLSRSELERALRVWEKR